MARLILLALLCPFFVMAQTTAITGRVTAANTKAPLAGASVFLSNSSFGTSTTADGVFSLKDLKPGQYNLVVSMIGYTEHTETISVNDSPIKLNIELSPKNIQLKEVNISTLSRAERKLALDRFKEEFIGDCKLTNPDALNFSFHKNKNVLEAYTDDFLIIENQALGYRIKFLLTNFKSDRLNGTVSYAGNQFFEEMPGKESAKKNWNKKRDEAYYGSAMHFYRSLYKDSLAAAGFKMYRLTRVLDTNRLTEDAIQKNLDAAKGKNDTSYLHWNKMKLASRYAKQALNNAPLIRRDILHRTDQPGLFAVKFPDYLYVIYTKKWETSYFKDIYRSPNMLNYETTIISLINEDKVMFFDSNGSTIGDSPLYEGTWSKSRLSEKLPVDFAPNGPPADVSK